MAGSIFSMLYGLIELAIFTLIVPLLMYQSAKPKTKKRVQGPNGRTIQQGVGIGRIDLDLRAAQPLTTTIPGLFPGSRLTWDPKKDMPSQVGKVAIVTGGNAGIGYATVRELLGHGARVYIASRAHERSANAVAKLEAEIRSAKPGSDHSKAQVKLLPCDLLDLSSVTRAANNFLRQETTLDILVCNAGIAFAGPGMKSAQGYSPVFATNVLGHHTFVEHLIDVLARTASSKGGEPSRVCMVSSMGHNAHHPAGFDAADPEWLGPVRMTLGIGGYSIPIPFTQNGMVRQMTRYGHSKFLNAVQAKVYQRNHGSRGIVFASVDPGTNVSDIARDVSPLARAMVWPLLGYNASYGASSSLYAVTSPNAKKLAGAHVIPWSRIMPAAGLANDIAMQDSFYAYCEQQRSKHGV